MSDTNQNVVKAALFAALPSCPSPVSLDVQYCNLNESLTFEPCDFKGSSKEVSQHISNTHSFNNVYANSPAQAFPTSDTDKRLSKFCPSGNLNSARQDDSVKEKCAEEIGRNHNTESRETDFVYAKCLTGNLSSENKPYSEAEITNAVDKKHFALNVQSKFHTTTTPDIRASRSPISEHIYTEINQSSKPSDKIRCKFASTETKNDFRITETDCYHSGSSDETLQNSENNSTEADEVLHEVKQNNNYKNKRYNTMGNKQGRTPKGHSDDDTPDDGRTKCCEIPKKKMKERSGKGNRTSRNDDLNFDANEVYPFDSRTRSEQDINEPVELEPFEIVETDDIKFVPGAGTSEVIKSVSEPRFTPIAEEPSLLEEVEPATTSNAAQETNVKVPFYIDKGNRLIEPGTATAHSTFEFKQVKPKIKVSKPSKQTQPSYENVSIEETRKESGVSERKPSSSGSKSSSSSSSKNVSRKNSKDAIQKPARKGKTITSSVPEDSNVAGAISEKKRQTEKSQKQPSIRDSEIDRNIDNVLMLTQTMFSQTKVEKNQDTKQESETQGQTVVLTQYENVNVCAKLEPTGITITHKNTPSDFSKVSKEKATTSGITCTGSNCEGREEKVTEVQVKKTRRNHNQYSTDIVEISDSGTLIIKSLADLPSAKQSEEIDDEHNKWSSGDEGIENSELKVPYETIDRLSTEIKKETLGIETPSQTEEKEFANEKEHVPPPSPLTMAALEEEEEEEEDIEEDDDIDFREEDRRKSDILEFTENVCKRLSLLLEGVPHEEAEADESDPEQTEEKKPTHYEDHIYETIDGSSRGLDQCDGVNSHVLITDAGDSGDVEVKSETTSDSWKLSTRSESSSTLKRTSGDSETYKSLDTRKSSQSDDELPDYFDPREIPLPKRDSEILCEVLDTYTDDASKVKELPSNEVKDIVEKHSLDFRALNYDNLVLENKDKDISSAVKYFETGQINNAPAPIKTEDLQDITPTVEALPNLTALLELAKAEEETPVQFETSGRQSATCTESDIDVSEHRDDLSTDSMLADDEAEETMEILFTKTYTEPVEGAEVFLSCTVVNSAYKDEQKKSETWLSDEALEYLEANASEVMSTAFLKAKKEMKDIQICLQSLRQQMEHFHSDCDDISLPEIPVDSLSPDYFGMPIRKAVTD